MTGSRWLEDNFWLRGTSSEDSEPLRRRFADSVGSGCNMALTSGLADEAEWIPVVVDSILVFNFFFSRFSAPFAETSVRSNDPSSLKDCPYDCE